MFWNKIMDYPLLLCNIIMVYSGTIIYIYIFSPYPPCYNMTDMSSSLKYANFCKMPDIYRKKTING